eukprot:g1413.t2
MCDHIDGARDQCARETILEGENGIKELTDPHRRAQSEPPRVPCRNGSELKAANDLLQNLKAEIASAEVEGADLEKQLHLQMEQKLQIIKLDAKTHELLDELAIVEAILCRSECSSCQFMHELAAKNSEHDLLEEECDRLREEVEKLLQERQVAKKIVPTRGEQYAGESASPMLLLEAHRRRSNALLSLSESRSAKMEAVRKQQEAKDLENAARAEAKEKEVLLQQRRESLLARETALTKEWEGLNDQFEQAQKSQEAIERRRLLWGELLQKGRARHDMIQSKVECAETKASLACGEASQELRWQIRQLREETEEQLNQKSIELTQEQEVAVKMREEVQQLVDAATNANEIRAALESELAGAKAELASNHAQRTRLEARNLELEEQAGVPRNFWMQLQAHFFEAQYEYFSSRVDSKIDALVAGIEGLNMLMRNLDSAYLCPLLAAKNFKLVAEWATAASHPWRARCLLQLGNIFKLQAMARWYNQLPQSEPRETASKRFEPRLQVEYTIAVTQLHASLQTPLRPLVRWQGAQPRIQVQSICNYRSPAALRNMYAYAHYSKMLVIHQAFLSESPDWVFFIDCDAFFTDAQTSLADILATYGATELSGPHFLVAEDPGGINTGTAEKCKLCFRSFRTF